MLGTAILLGVSLAAADACEQPSERSRSPCRDRVGHCFDLTIDAQPVVPLADDELRVQLEDVVSQDVCWRLEAPASGAIEAVVEANGFTAEHLGELFDEIEVVVIPLAGQEIPTRQGVRKDPTVRIGGLPMQTIVDVVDVAALPDGPYVATFRARGPGGWDRKAVHFVVDRSDGASSAPAGEERVDATAAYDPNNIFARIIRGEAPADIVYENAHALAFHDIRPKAPVHVLVAPKGPYTNIVSFEAEASAEEKLALLEAIAETARTMGVNESGFRLISNTGEDGGQTVPHLHFHIQGGADVAERD